MSKNATRCPQDGPISSAIKRILGRAPTASCELVGLPEMEKTLKKHGWHNVDYGDFYGFHTDDNRVLVRDTAPWSVLHERIHDAGVQDHSVGRWVCEGTAEVLAKYMHEHQGFDWRPTYHDYVAVIENEVLPRANLDIVTLARGIARRRMARAWLAVRLHHVGQLPRWAAQHALRDEEPDAFLRLCR